MHPAVRQTYADLKRDLAQKRPDDIVAYMDGKDGLIKQLGVNRISCGHVPGTG
jgi:GrpB-like predicted nucleotidyltransferase (UPF0157 family)